MTTHLYHEVSEFENLLDEQEFSVGGHESVCRLKQII